MVVRYVESVESQDHLVSILSSHQKFVSDSLEAEEAYFQGVRFSCNLSFEGLDLRRARLNDCFFDYTSFHRADMRGAFFDRCQFYSADLSKADMRDTGLRNCVFTAVDFQDANMRYASLTGSNFNRDFMRGADLTGACLWDVTGNMDQIKSLQLDRYKIAYTSERIQIGCENHSIEDWFSFPDSRIQEMDFDALEWWVKWKPVLQQIIETSPATPFK